MLRITDTIALQEWELTEHFVRAQGPGGQNVNKVATAVELRFAAAASPSLTDPVKRRLKRLAGRRWTTSGEVVLQVSSERAQARNREIARDRLAELIRRALIEPKKRKPTRVSASQKRKRLEAKRQRSSVKALRGKVDED